MDNTHPHPPAAPWRLQGSFSASTASDPSLATMSASFSNTLDTVPVSQSRSSNARRQAKHSVRKTQTTNFPGYLCFSISGKPVKAAQRSAFSPVRREQVKQLRKQGACLRCKLMKRACSGENPCERCLDAARAAAESKTLTWMDCTRLSFDEVNIFSTGISLPDPAQLRGLMTELGNESINLEFAVPFEMNIDESSTYLARWLTDDSTHSKISLIGLFSTSEIGHLIHEAVGEPLGESLRLMIHLTTQILVNFQNTEYRGTSLGDLRMLRDHAGCKILSALDQRLKPQQLETSPNKLNNMKGLFLLVLGTAIGARYAFMNKTPVSDIQDKEKALLRLLCHYLLYIGNTISILDRSCDLTKLLSEWTYDWNKPAAFWWQICKDGPKQGLDEDPFAPPSEFPMAFTEDLGDPWASLNDHSISEMFPETVACTSCGELWLFLDTNGRCGNCGPEFNIEDIEWPSFDPPNALPTTTVSRDFVFDSDDATWLEWNQIPTSNNFTLFPGVSSAEQPPPAPEPAVSTSDTWSWTVERTETVASANDPPPFLGTFCEFGLPEEEPTSLTSDPWSWTVKRTEIVPSANDPPPFLGAFCPAAQPKRKKTRREIGQDLQRARQNSRTERQKAREEENRVDIIVDYPCPICSVRFCKAEKGRQARRFLSGLETKGVISSRKTESGEGRMSTKSES